MKLCNTLETGRLYARHEACYVRAWRIVLYVYVAHIYEGGAHWGAREHQPAETTWR